MCRYTSTCKIKLINNYLKLWVFLQAQTQTSTTKTAIRNGVRAISDDKNVYLILIIFITYKSEHATYAIKVFSSLVATGRRNLQ